MRVSGEAHGLGVITLSSWSAMATHQPPARRQRHRHHRRPLPALPSPPPATSTSTASYHSSYTSNTPPPSAATATLHGLPPDARQAANRMLHHASHGCGLGAAAACWSDGARGWTAAGYRGRTALRAGHGWSHRLTVSASATRGIRRAGDGIRRHGSLFNEHAFIF